MKFWTSTPDTWVDIRDGTIWSNRYSINRSNYSKVNRLIEYVHYLPETVSFYAIEPFSRDVFRANTVGNYTVYNPYRFRTKISSVRRWRCTANIRDNFNIWNYYVNVNILCSRSHAYLFSIIEAINKTHLDKGIAFTHFTNIGIVALFCLLLQKHILTSVSLLNHWSHQ